MTIIRACLIVLVGVGAGALTATAKGQVPGTPGGPGDGVGVGPSYRFYERYSTEDAPASSGAIGQAKVAFRESLSTAVETPRGAPERSERVIQAIYRERPAEVDPADSRRVVAAVRAYETVRISPPPEDARPSDRKPFEGLTIWLAPRVDLPPEVLVLTPGGALTDQEYVYAARQVFVPDLGHALPDLPIRVGESYQVSRLALATLLGGMVQEGELTGTLQGIEEDGNGGRVAVFNLRGRGVIDLGPVGVHAEIRFACTTAGPPAAAPGDPGASAIDASGQVVRLSLAAEIALAAGSGDGRLRQQIRRELVLERRTDEPGPLLEVPARAPQPTPENSWLIYQDPQGRFSFRHPQDLNPQGQPDSDSVELYRPRPGGGDVVLVSLLPNAELQPDAIQKDLQAQWRADRLEVEPGDSGPLPEADWPGLRVTRIEATHMPPGSRGNPNALRVHFAGYVVQTGRPLGLYVESRTSQNPPQAFREQIEAMIRSLTFERAATGGATNAAGSESPRPAPDETPAPGPG